MNAATLPRPQILILAAGFSRRLGTPKALVRVHGLSLLRRTVALMAPFAAKTIVVIPPRAARYRIELRGFNVTYVANRQRATGMSSSVRRGIAQARYSPALLLVPVDLVNLRRRDIARLIGRWSAARRRVVARSLCTRRVAADPAAVAVWAGAPYRRRHWIAGTRGATACRILGARIASLGGQRYRYAAGSAAGAAPLRRWRV